MKKTWITACLTLILTFPAIASVNSSSDPRVPFAGQIEFLLNRDAVDGSMLNLEARVLFTFDAENRIRILEVRTGDSGLEAEIREKLEGYRVFLGKSLEGKRYVLPIRT